MDIYIEPQSPLKPEPM